MRNLKQNSAWNSLWNCANPESKASLVRIGRLLTPACPLDRKQLALGCCDGALESEVMLIVTYWRRAGGPTVVQMTFEQSAAWLYELTVEEHQLTGSLNSLWLSLQYLC